ncbi:MAG: DUF5357 family protein [Microcoleaceae cyanobacterium]
MKAVNWVRGAVAPVVVPPKPFHWKTLLLISIGLWAASFLFQGEEAFRDSLATLGWLLLTISVCWRTTQPPFVLFGIPLSPWITGTLLCVLVHSDVSDENPYLAFKLWPLISAILLIIIELFQVRFKVKESPLFDRSQFILLLLLHLNFICWIEFYIVTSQWLEQNPGFLQETPIIRQT